MNTSIDLYFKIYEIQPTEHDVVSKLVQNAAKIALCSFLNRYTVLLMFHSTFTHHLHGFFKTYELSLLVQKDLYEPQTNETIEQYVILVTSSEELAETLDWLAEYEFDNTGKYIIVCYSSDVHDCDEFEILKLCWEYKIVNVVYLTTNKGLNDVQYFSFDPFQEDNCENSEPKSIALDNNICKVIFPKKCSNLQLCPIVASTVLQMPFMNFTEAGKPYGVDGDLLVIIGEALNASLKVMTPRNGYGWGSKLDNGSWSGSFGDIYEGFANFSMTSAAVALHRVESFQMSVDYSSISLVWVTCPTKLRPSWEKLMKPFNPLVNILMVVVFLLVAIINILIKSDACNKFMRKWKFGGVRSSLVFYSWMSFMGLPMNRLTKKLSLQVAVLLWIWYGFLIRSVYQGALITALKSQIHYPEIKSLAEGIEAGYGYGAGVSIKYYYIEEPDILENFVILEPEDIPQIMANLSDGWKFLVVFNMEMVTEYIRENKGERQLYILPDTIASYPTMIFFKKYSPFLQPINEILMKLNEGGFVEKFYRDYTAIVKTDERLNAPITLEEYTGCFVILSFGYIISAIYFVVELYKGLLKK